MCGGFRIQQSLPGNVPISDERLEHRIYDITNVLEGIGLIEKKSKNNIQWKGCGDVGDADNADVDRLQDLIAELDEQTGRVDGYISKLTQDLEAQQALAPDAVPNPCKCSHFCHQTLNPETNPCELSHFCWHTADHPSSAFCRFPPLELVLASRSL